MSVSTKCTRPLVAWHDGTTLSFKPLNGVGNNIFGSKRINLPCNKCIGCRLRYAKEWAIRCMHEAHVNVSKENCFITLTYNNDHLPKDGSLNKRTLQLFMKRLRKQTKKELRFFACGEYGEKLGRPHYHLLIFGYDFPDRKLFNENKNPDWNLYTSKLLTEVDDNGNIIGGVWPYGYSTIGNCSFESASYTARYVTKKINGEKAKEHYNGKLPEFALMSRGNGKNTKGLGSKWFDIFGELAIRQGFVYSRGYKQPIPKYYYKLLADKYPGCANLYKQIRTIKAGDPIVTDFTINSRAYQEEQAKQKLFSKMIRNLEVDS
jgi:hypothetical protein